MEEIRIIERYPCPPQPEGCGAYPLEHCRKVRDDETRIWPFHEGTAGPEWVHPARRDWAVQRGEVDKVVFPRRDLHGHL